MSTIRRRVLRSELPVSPATVLERRRRRAQEKLNSQLERERAALVRWMTRLKRAFHAVERGQLRVARFERKFAELDQG